MKYISLILIMVFTLIVYGCDVSEQAENLDAADVLDVNNEDVEIDHMGCQESEIDINGVCVTADDNNAGMFDQDLGSSVTTQDITGDFRGYLAKPAEEGEYPGIIMIHEWWGLNDNIKQMARILANEGYVVLAIDLYDGQVATDSERASQLASLVRSGPEDAIEKMQNAVLYLEVKEEVTSVGSIGWCFGGGQSLALSLNDEIDATVIYYGSLVTDSEELSSLNGPVLGIFGATDSSIPVETVRNFELSLEGLGIENHIYVYDGVGHAFANPSGSNYAEEETLDAWGKTVDFFNEELKMEG